MNLTSELEEKQNELYVGCRVLYSDANNFMTYEIIKIDENGIEVQNEETFEEVYHTFKSLQIGWSICAKQRKRKGK